MVILLHYDVVIVLLVCFDCVAEVLWLCFSNVVIVLQGCTRDNSHTGSTNGYVRQEDVVIVLQQCCHCVAAMLWLCCSSVVIALQGCTRDNSDTRSTNGHAGQEDVEPWGLSLPVSGWSWSDDWHGIWGGRPHHLLLLQSTPRSLS